MSYLQRSRFRFSLLFILSFAFPVQAQIDLSGEWGAVFHEDSDERRPGPEMVEYQGIPINEAARRRALSWSPSLLTLPEHQCKPHPSDYGSRGPSNMRIWKEIDSESQQLIAYHTRIRWQAPERTIWMDGRGRPPEYAAHTWQGFSTGHWEGNVLVVRTTHLKQGWARRNGIARSDLSEFTEHFIRHGNIMTQVVMVSDPVYLTEPFIRTNNWKINLAQQIPPYLCETVTEIDRPQGEVPHYLPDQNPFLREHADRYNLPLEGVLGGAETMYPSFIE
ncbi:MAG: hypothetical protein P8J61_10980 [Gammaproteobacteria bacterium]|nr:hypothetical protein [Gammaproteobacteria bacterium]